MAAYPNPLHVLGGLQLDFTVEAADEDNDSFLGVSATGQLTVFSTIPSSRITGSGNLSEVTSDVLVIGGVTGALLSDVTIRVMQAGASQDGYLSSDDWNTFNANLGTTLDSAQLYVGSNANVATARTITGDVTFSNTGVTAIAAGVIVNTDINASAAIAFSKMAAFAGTSLITATDGSGFITTVPSFTTTIAGFLTNITADVQAQLDEKDIQIVALDTAAIVRTPTAVENGYAIIWDQANGEWNLGPVGGGGSVTGPGSSTDNAIVTWNGTGGTSLLSNASGVILDDSGNMGDLLSVTTKTLNLLDSDDSHTLSISATSDLTSDQTLSIVTGDASRIITLSGNPTLSDWFDQSVKVAADPTFSSVTASNAGGLRVLDSNGSHDLVFTTTSDLSADRTITLVPGDASWTLTINASGTLYVTGGTDVSLADGGTGASLADPGADRILFWDDSAGAVTWLTAGSGLTITGTTIEASGGGGSIGGSTGGTDNALIRADGTGGSTIQSSAVIVDDSANMTGLATVTTGALHLLDTNASHDLIISAGSNLTADRILSFVTGDSARTITFDASGTVYVTGGTDVALADGGTGASLADPGADRIMFWDDSAGAVTWLTAGTGLTITTTTIEATGTIGGSTGSADNSIIRADGTGGLTVQSSSLFVDDSGSLTNTSGLEYLRFTNTASAINEFTIINAAASGSPEFKVSGGDSAIGMKLSTVGLGEFTMLAAASTWTLGAAAFTNSTDAAGIVGSTAASLQTSNKAAGTSTGAITIRSGSISGFGSGNTGNISLITGTPDAGNQGDIFIDGRNLAIGATSVASWQSMINGLFIAGGSAPSGNPPSQGIFSWVASDAWMWRDDNGNIYDLRGVISGLTAGRVPFASSAFELEDDANFTYAGSVLTAPSFNAGGNLEILNTGYINMVVNTNLSINAFIGTAGVNNGSDLFLNGGNAYVSSGSGNGGDVIIRSGNSGPSGGTPGNIELIAGAGTGSTDDGTISLQSGDGLIEFTSNSMQFSVETPILGLYNHSDYGTSHTATVQESVITLNGTGAQSLFLPPVADAEEKIYYLKVVSGTATWTVNPDASELIDGASTYVMSGASDAGAIIYCDGTEWWVLSKF